MTALELLDLVVGVIGKAVGLAQKIRADQTLDHDAAKVALEAADAALTVAIKALDASLAANDAAVDAELAARTAPKPPVT